LKAFEYEPIYKKSTLDNGVRVITEHHPFSRSVCAGITVDLGSRDESEDLAGAAHFVEHMVFKGTETRDAYEIARSLEAVGGDLNAYTSKEQTCFHATCLKEDLPMALDLLSDLMSNAQFDANDFKKEREVILQEMNMVGDELDEYAYDLFFSNIYKKHELGRPILGTQKSLVGTSRSKLYDFYLKRYHGHNMIVSVAGNVDHEFVCEALRRTLNLRRRSITLPERKKPHWRPFALAERRDSEQAHVIIGLQAPHHKDKLRYESYILNALLGGGMTSRLYQKIREKQGLSYTVYSMLQSFVDSGVLTIYAGTSGKHVPTVVGTIMRELESLTKRGVSSSELKFFKKQVIGAFLLDADDVESRMNSITHNEAVFNAYKSVEETIRDIEAVSVDSLTQYIKKYIDLEKVGMLVVGDINEVRTEKLLKSYK
jgi:predicted Zn-dependent peptidase